MKILLKHTLPFLLIPAIGLGTLFIGLQIWGSWHDEWSGYTTSQVFSDGECNIAVIPIEGEIVSVGSDVIDENGFEYITTSADKFASDIRRAEADVHIVGILIRIDSGGGSPVASEVMMDALKATPLPSVALIREIGSSGAYLAATGADIIYASPFSDVGSIGVTMSYLEKVEQNKRDGLDFVSLSSAPYKDTMNPNSFLTATEHALLTRDLDIYHKYFVELVATNRGITVQEVNRLADGSSMPGALALDTRLIDAIGNQTTARGWFAGRLELKTEEVIFCE